MKKPSAFLEVLINMIFYVRLIFATILKNDWYTQKPFCNQNLLPAIVNEGISLGVDNVFGPSLDDIRDHSPGLGLGLWLGLG